VRRHPVGEGQKPTQQLQLLFPEPRDAGEALRAREYGKQ